MSNVISQLPGIKEILDDLYEKIKSQGIAEYSYIDSTIHQGKYVDVKIINAFNRQVRVLIKQEIDGEYLFIESQASITVYYSEDKIRIVNETDEDINIRILYLDNQENEK